ncbi:type II secretion system protein [PVC group bacterium]|nr:type II secretion system protein [PVC group bacterium]
MEKKRTLREDQPKAFTLLEMMVVIAIIAILGSLLLTVLHRTRETAYASTCTSNLRQMGQALMLYMDDNRHYFPSMSGGGFGDRWYNTLNSYLNNQDIFICPASNFQIFDDRIKYAYNDKFGYDTDPAKADEYQTLEDVVAMKGDGFLEPFITGEDGQLSFSFDISSVEAGVSNLKIIGDGPRYNKFVSGDGISRHYGVANFVTPGTNILKEASNSIDTYYAVASDDDLPDGATGGP